MLRSATAPASAPQGVDEATLNASWNGALMIAGILWSAGLAGCLVQAMSPLTAGIIHWLLIALVGLSAMAAALAFRIIQRDNMKGNLAAELAAVVLLFAFGPAAFVFAAGTLPFMALRQRGYRVARRAGGNRIRWLPASSEVLAMVLFAFLGSTLWATPGYVRLTSWAVARGAQAPRLLDVSLPWWLVASVVVGGLTFMATFVVATIWWQRIIDAAISAHANDTRRRRQLTDRVSSLLHDGVLSVLERVAANQPLNAATRTSVGVLAQTIRNGFFNDDTPRTTGRLINHLVADCSSHEVVPIIADFIEGEPPAEILQAFAMASSAIIGNLQHAGVSEVLIGIVADTNKLHVTIRDEGCGFDLSTAHWSPHTSRVVFAGVASLDPQGEAVPTSEPGRGTSWTLRWPAQRPG